MAVGSFPNTDPYVPPRMGQFAVAGYQAPELSYWGETGVLTQECRGSAGSILQT